MKYIRTKYGIHIKSIFNKEASEEEWKSLGYEIIKQADTIKDLCDVYVVIDIRENVVTQIINSLQKAKNQKGIYEEIYGAIWIIDNNGAPILKPVAKMDGNGDLKLI